MTAALWFAGTKINHDAALQGLYLTFHIYGGDKERKLIQGWKTGGTVVRGEEGVGGRGAS